MVWKKIQKNRTHWITLVAEKSLLFASRNYIFAGLIKAVIMVKGPYRAGIQRLIFEKDLYSLNLSIHSHRRNVFASNEPIFGDFRMNNRNLLGLKLFFRLFHNVQDLLYSSANLREKISYSSSVRAVPPIYIDGK
jgi:hypothetical protein